MWLRLLFVSAAGLRAAPRVFLAPPLDSPHSHDWEDVSPWKDLGCERKLNCRTPGQRAVTWKHQGRTDVLLLFPRASSTGTVSCLYPLTRPSLLSFPNPGAGDVLIWNPNSWFICCIVRSCVVFETNSDILRSEWVEIGLITFISSAALPHSIWPVD